MPLTEQDLLKLFGKHLAQLRKDRGLTQQQLAEKLNMSVVGIAYLETGKRWARMSTLQKLCRVLHVKLKDLFDF